MAIQCRSGRILLGLGSTTYSTLVINASGVARTSSSTGAVVVQGGLGVEQQVYAAKWVL